MSEQKGIPQKLAERLMRTPVLDVTEEGNGRLTYQRVASAHQNLAQKRF